MALKLAPQQHGATVTLRGPRGSALLVHAPDGLQLRIPASHGRATLWLPQAGEWRYEWDVPGMHGPSGAITVLPPAIEEPPKPRYRGPGSGVR